MKTEPSKKDWLLLSRYLAGALSRRQVETLESRLSAESDLAEALLQLKRTRFMLANLSLVPAPHDFTINPSSVPARKTSRLFPVFRLSTAICSILFVVTLAYTTLVLPSQRDQTMMMTYTGEPQVAEPKAAVLSEDSAVPTIESFIGTVPFAGAGSPPSVIPTQQITRGEGEVEEPPRPLRSPIPWAQILWILGGLSLGLGGAAIVFYHQERA